MLIPSAVITPAQSSVPLMQNGVLISVAAADSRRVPSGVTSINIDLWGGGASGRYAGTGGSGKSGSSGAYCRRTSKSVTAGDIISFTIGPGGAAVMSGSLGQQNAGSNSTCDGMTAGGASTSAGGAASGGNTNTNGNTAGTGNGASAPGTGGGSGGTAPGGDGVSPGGGGADGSFPSPINSGGGGNGGIIFSW